MDTWSIKKLAGHCGARLEGVSLANASTSQLQEMRSALFEHGVIVMPEQHLSPDQHIKLAEFFGEINVNRFFTPVTNHPIIAEIRTSPDQAEVIGGTWPVSYTHLTLPTKRIV